MALTTLHPIDEVTVQAHSASVGGTPIAAIARAPFRGTVKKVGCVLVAAVTTSNLLVSTAINGTAITGGGFSITAAGSAAGSTGTATPTGANAVNEDDYITFTPSVAAGTNVPATFFAVIRRA